MEHVRPRSRGGTDRASNVVLACVPCNQEKGSQPIGAFLSHDPARLAEIVDQLEDPQLDAAVMNATGQQLLTALDLLRKPVHIWSGSRTRANRRTTGLPKSHTLDALLTGPLDPEADRPVVRIPGRILLVTASGRGSYARTTPDRFGFPRLHRVRAKQLHGFVSGDVVRAAVPRGKWAGVWTGTVAVRARGQHRVTTAQGRFDVSYRHLTLLQRADGHTYAAGAEPGMQTGRKTG